MTYESRPADNPESAMPPAEQYLTEETWEMLLALSERRMSGLIAGTRPLPVIRVTAGFIEYDSGGHSHTPNYKDAASPAVPEAAPTLPDKPLAECGVEDLKDLSEGQLAEMLVRSSRYADRNISVFGRNGLYSIHLAEPPEEKPGLARFGSHDEPISADNITVGILPPGPEQHRSYETIEIGLPHVPYGSFQTFVRALPVLNAKLEAMGRAPINEYRGFYRDNEALFDMYWNNDYSRMLKEHNYGDGGLFAKYETAEGVLAQEVRELQELGFDFDTIAAALETAITTDELPEGMQRYTIPWRFCVISTPFKGVQYSTLDHGITREDKPGWHIPISETSLSLYKNRVVEGYYLPHYRISAARTVWALQMGTPEQQAKAFGMDWQRSIDFLQESVRRRDRFGINNAMNYMIKYFPRDDTPWREHGFGGYHYDGTTYPSLRDMLVDVKAKHAHIQFPKHTIQIGVNAYERDIDDVR